MPHSPVMAANGVASGSGNVELDFQCIAPFQGPSLTILHGQARQESIERDSSPQALQVDTLGSCAVLQSCFESDAKGATRPIGLRIHDFFRARRS